jgi:hypothetical protein
MIKKGFCHFATSLIEMMSFLTELDIEPLMSDELCDKVSQRKDNCFVC